MSDDWQETALLQADEVVRLNKEYDKAMSRIAELEAKLAIAIDGLKHLYRNDASPSGIAHDAVLDAILAKLKEVNDER